MVTAVCYAARVSGDLGILYAFVLLPRFGGYGAYKPGRTIREHGGVFDSPAGGVCS